MVMFSSAASTMVEDTDVKAGTKSDFSNVVTHLNSGKLVVDRLALVKTAKFQKNLEILNRIADRYHNSNKP